MPTENLYTFGFGECAQFFLVRRIKFLLCNRLQLLAILPASCPSTATDGMTTGTEERVVPHPTVIQERMIEGIHTRDPLFLEQRWTEGDKGEGPTSHGKVTLLY